MISQRPEIKWILPFIAFFVFHVFTSPAQSQEAIPKLPKEGKTLGDFVPTGWDSLMVVSGDINKDGLIDRVLVLKSRSEDTAGDMPRLLVILLQTQAGYLLSGFSPSAVMCRGCGGVFGDPFNEVSVNGNVITVSHYGGSNWRWAYTHEFRLEQGEWYLIRRRSEGFFIGKQCEESGDFAPTDVKDEDLVTGEQETLKVDENCAKQTNKKKTKPLPLIKLSEFDVDANSN